MDRTKHYALYTVIGAAAYWLPDILIQWLRPTQQVWIVLLTFIVPAIVFATWLALSRHHLHAGFRVGLPLFMLLGVWLFGPLGIAIGMVPNGGTFLVPDQLGQFLVLWAMFPFTTFVMSTYSGSLGGVGLATLVLLIAAIVGGIREKTSNIAVKRDAPQAARPLP